jgi:hypothetical protein
MWKQLLICAALLTPSAAFADDQTPGNEPDGSEKDLCYDIGTNYDKCIKAKPCFWDTSDVRCEWIVDPQHCSFNTDVGICNANPFCFWDTSDVRCERLYT